MIFFIHGFSDQEQSQKFDAIYEKYYRYAYTIAFRIVHNTSAMEEIMQDTFLNVWKSLNVITDEVSAKAWIATIARNTALNYLAKENTRRSKVLDIDDDVLYSETPDCELDPVALTEIQDNVNRVYQNIRELDKKYSDVLLLNIKFHMPPEEIAKYLQRNVKTAYTQLSRGKGMLRQSLSTDCRKGGAVNE